MSINPDKADLFKNLPLNDPTVENIIIHGHDQAVVQRADGTNVRIPSVATSDNELHSMIQALQKETEDLA